MVRALWRNFLTGLVVIFPAFLTLSILQILFKWAFHLVIAPFARLIAPWVTPGWAMWLAYAAIGAGFIFLVAAIGRGTQLLLFQRALRWGESFVERVPLVGKVYGTIREIADALGGSHPGAFSRVVLLEWPRKGLYVLGFVTSEGKGEVQDKTLEEVINVFVPTTPNPTSGYLILADRTALIPLEMSVQEGMKLVISGGVVGPGVKPGKAGKVNGDP